jgi:enoyl-CoA hydratase
MGLANRIVAEGRARAEAEALAHEIARFPQLCVNVDRRSADEGWNHGVPESLRAEAVAGDPLAHGVARDGAARFAEGRGRGGDFGAL